MRFLPTYLLAVIVLLFATISYADTQKYTLDPTHTYVQWHVSHFGFSSPSGKWLAEGNLWLDEEKPNNSKLEVTIQLANIVTGIPKLDNHLKGTDFLDVAQFPTATFKSTKIKVAGKNTAKVTGNLTLHGITKSIVLTVRLNKLDTNPLSQKRTAGFSASTTIKRSEFGLGKYTPGVSDTVTIEIEAEANKAE
ncbi:MAG: hypothetical protein A3E84_01850 [Gammaproteobacteria bacterium RIFCSPHIGHO2_12_FULL_42_13]|nr:MAG: hypothetical protein A3E84_01850 [Gammaproteobacteria bacterium RIFCSPHIGHO2_12_FULL_42_13]